MSGGRIKKLLSLPQSYVAYAEWEGEVVGYAICIQASVANFGEIAWVTQLVVHEQHRMRSVGKSILFSIWGFSDYVAWGLLTANPYAVRALEKATHRRCSAATIHANVRRIRECGLRYVDYIDGNMQMETGKAASRMNTKFPVDHSNLQEMLRNVTGPFTPWTLGQIAEGWEWVAFTFRDQPEIDMSTDEIETMLRASDEIAKQLTRECCWTGTMPGQSTQRRKHSS